MLYIILKSWNIKRDKDCQSWRIKRSRKRWQLEIGTWEMGNGRSRRQHGVGNTERIRWSPLTFTRDRYWALVRLLSASHLFLRVLSFPVIRWQMSTRSVPQITFSRQINAWHVHQAKIGIAETIRDRLKLHIENCTSNIIVAILRSRQIISRIFYAHSCYRLWRNNTAYFNDTS